MVWLPIAALTMFVGAFAFILWEAWRYGRIWEEKDRLRSLNR